ncbi:hypothetical protein GOP47_0004047 [Adiantum capillus-veneris]|uniref:Uncharacterized protein n=1 Tax=Adiantum capillus-veneris TaxID=13818 RepID=A0A9D4V6V0_ADICA|nr:hypothetical protein GOP47_0004047 [Adiantum capillus-veneris]
MTKSCFTSETNNFPVYWSDHDAIYILLDKQSLAPVNSSNHSLFKPANPATCKNYPAHSDLNNWSLVLQRAKSKKQMQILFLVARTHKETFTLLRTYASKGSQARRIPKERASQQQAANGSALSATPPNSSRFFKEQRAKNKCRYCSL